MRLVPPLFLSILLLAGPACAVRSTAHVVRAERALHRAAERGAQQDAVYEYTLAERYLEKAREQAAHARHASAADLARAAEAYADQAVIVMQERGLGEDPGTETPTATPEPAVEPAAEPAAEPAPEETGTPESPVEDPAIEPPAPEPPVAPAPAPQPLWDDLEPPPPDLEP